MFNRGSAVVSKESPSNVIPFRRKPAAPQAEKPLRAAKARDPDHRHDAASCEAHAQMLFAENRLGAVLEFLSRAVAWHPRSRELHYLYAADLLNAGLPEKAAQIARRLVYLDPRSVAAHMLLGAIAQQRGDSAGAMRAYRNGLSFCASVPEDEVVPLTGNERYGRVAAALAAEISVLQSAERAS